MRLTAAALATALATALALAAGHPGTAGAAGDISSVRPATTSPEPAASWQAWTSDPHDPTARLVEAPLTSAPPTRVLDVFPADTRQEWIGAGAALTDSAAGLLQASAAATEMLFDPDQRDGAHLNLVRLPLSATDFSTVAWTFGWNDLSRTLTVPDVADNSAAFVVDDLMRLRPDLEVVGVPWSAPAAMKTTGSLNGGALRGDRTAEYARLLLAQADWLVDRGVALRALSLGNEPFHSASGPGGYPTMLMSDQQMVALARDVAPSLRDRDVDLWAVDHNWDHRVHYDVVSQGAPGAFAASAFHCYGGNPAQMDGVASPPVITECTGTTDGFAGTFRWDITNLVVEPIRAGSTGLMMWNLALDENHGPHTGGCGTCRGVVDIDTADGNIVRTPEFYTLAHLTRAATPGARVVGTTPTASMPYAAFVNPDGQVGIVGHNDTGTSQVIAVRLGGGLSAARITVAPGNLFTIRGTQSLPSPQNLAPPEVTGTARVGAVIEASPGVWSPADASISFRWRRSGDQIRGATGAQYRCVPDDLGHHLSVKVTAEHAGMTPEAVVVQVPDEVAHGLIEVAARGRIAGRLRRGRTLTLTGLSATPAPATSFQWRRNGSPIDGARLATYRLRAADRGKRISVRVSLRADGYAPVSFILRRRNPVG